MPTSFDFFQDAVSPARLRPFQVVGEAPVDTVSRYLWNVCLCESLYAPLQHLEITLRNSLHTAIGIHQNNTFWLHEATPWLDTWEQQKIREAKSRLGVQPSPGKIVSDLNFGFWTGLFDSRYEQILWPRLVVRVFPQFQPYSRPRQKISRRLNDIRHLRNRIFHHEPIWSDPRLSLRYDEILECLYWLNPTVHTLTKACETFPIVSSPQKQAQIRAAIAPYF